MNKSNLNLNLNQKKIYNKILSNLKVGSEFVSLPTFCDLNEVFDIFKLVLGDNPEFFYYDNCNISTLGSKVCFKKLYGTIEKLNKQKSFDLTSNSIISSVVNNKMNDAQKVLAIHNYLATNIQYNHLVCNCKLKSESHTAYGAIVNKVAVCEGIASAFSHLLHLCGINCSVINGSTDSVGNESHCWNIVNIGNNYFHVDVTWDMETNNTFSTKCFDYFGLTDYDLSNRSWKNYYQQCLCGNYNYFFLSNSIAHNDKELCEIALRQIKRNRRIYLKYTYLDKNMNESQVSSYVIDLLKKDEKLYSYLIGAFTYRVNVDQNILLIEEN